MEDLRIGFVIMQIGDNELDNLYTEVYYPAIKAANLIPKRIDLDNEGNLLKSEILDNIEKAEIIIADLTNERPNCYLEVGYTMGIDKYKNLIFTAREDHYPDSSNYKKEGPKIHFDVSGYDILFWEIKKLDDFKTKLIEKINRRLLIISPNIKKVEKAVWDESWLENQRSHVKKQLETLGFLRKLEILVTPIQYELSILQNELLEIADNSQIVTTGWPIGVVLKNVPEYKPISKTDGIISEVIKNRESYSYDFTYFRKNGQIFLTKNLWEEKSHNGIVLVEVRIKEVTEILFYILRFYSKCRLPKNERIKLSLKYSGLLNNEARFVDARFIRWNQNKSSENECVIEIETSLIEIENTLPEKVHELLKSFFLLFDFFELEYGFVKDIVDEFIIRTNNARR
jgi:hypothetical protein